MGWEEERSEPAWAACSCYVGYLETLGLGQHILCVLDCEMPWYYGVPLVLGSHPSSSSSLYPRVLFASDVSFNGLHVYLTGRIREKAYTVLSILDRGIFFFFRSWRILSLLMIEKNMHLVSDFFFSKSLPSEVSNLWPVGCFSPYMAETAMNTVQHKIVTLKVLWTFLGTGLQGAWACPLFMMASFIHTKGWCACISLLVSAPPSSLWKQNWNKLGSLLFAFLCSVINPGLWVSVGGGPMPLGVQKRSWSKSQSQLATLSVAKWVN